MYIKELWLENFQKHSDLKIKFDQNINIICGSTDAGKSSIRRAIEWIFFNINCDALRKKDTKTTIVTVILDSGIKISRTRSASINRYEVQKPGEDPVVYDSIGKTIPEEVKEALGILTLEVDGEEISLNSAPQLALPFLFDRPASFRAKLFNKLTGNEKLDQALGSFNKEIFRIKREQKSNSEELELLTKEKSEIEQKKEIQEFKVKKAQKKIKELQEIKDKYLKLKELQEKLAKRKELLDLYQAKISENKIVELNNITEIKDKITLLNTLKSLSERLRAKKIQLNDLTSQLKDIKVPEVNFGEIKDKIDKYLTYKSWNDILEVNRDKISVFEGKVKKLDSEIQEAEKNYQNLLKEVGICPTCQRKIEECDES